MQIEIFLHRGAKRETVDTHPVQPGIITIGREPENTIRLADSRVSKTHAEIQFDGTKFTVTDCSMNGVLMAGQKLERGAPTPWNPGQTLKIIEYEFELTRDAAEITEPLSTVPDFDITLDLLLEQSHLSLAPGQSATLKFKITNESEHVVSRWAPRVSGLPRTWYTIQYEKWPEEGESNAGNGQTAREKLAPFDETTGIGVQQRSEQPYNQRIFHLTITVPAWESNLAATQANLAGTSWAGEREAILKIDQLGSGKTLAEARFSLAVLPVYKSLCDASPQKFRRGAPFGLTIINNSNVPDDYTIRWSDPENALHFEPEKETVRVGIGEQLTQTPIIRSRRRYWFGKPQEHELAVEVERTQEEVYAADLTFVNPPIIPRWAVILPVVALFVLLWMLRPIAELGVAAIPEDENLPDSANELGSNSALARICLEEPQRITTVHFSDGTPLADEADGCWYGQMSKENLPAAASLRIGNWLYSKVGVAVPELTYRRVSASVRQDEIAYATPTAIPAPPPTPIPEILIEKFSITPDSIVFGARNVEVQVCWTVKNASALKINGKSTVDNIKLALDDCKYLHELGMDLPTEDTAFTLEASGDGTENVKSRAAMLTVSLIECSVDNSLGANIRSGPGVNYPDIGYLTQGDEFSPVARNRRDSASDQGGDFWLKMKDQNAWVAESLVSCGDEVASLGAEENVGAPPPTATPTPTETPIPPTATPGPTAVPRITLNPDQDFSMPEGETRSVNWETQEICGVFLRHNNRFYPKQKNDSHLFSARSGNSTNETFYLDEGTHQIDWFFIPRIDQRCLSPGEMEDIARNRTGLTIRKTIVITVQ